MHSLTKLQDVLFAATVIWGVRVWTKLDGIKSNDGAWLFIYTGSCPGTKNMYIKLRRDYQNNPVYYNFKHYTSYDA